MERTYIRGNKEHWKEVYEWACGVKPQNDNAEGSCFVRDTCIIIKQVIKQGENKLFFIDEEDENDKVMCDIVTTNPYWHEVKPWEMSHPTLENGTKQQTDMTDNYIVVNGKRYDIAKKDDNSCKTCSFDENVCKLWECGIGISCRLPFKFVEHKGKNLIDFTDDKKGINKQSYYSFPNGVEADDICRYLSFNLGNVVKYSCRAGRKDSKKKLEDLRKAKDYLENEIKRLSEE